MIGFALVGIACAVLVLTLGASFQPNGWVSGFVGGLATTSLYELHPAAGWAFMLTIGVTVFSLMATGGSTRRHRRRPRG